MEPSKRKTLIVAGAAVLVLALAAFLFYDPAGPQKMPGTAPARDTSIKQSDALAVLREEVRDADGLTISEMRFDPEYRQADPFALQGRAEVEAFLAQLDFGRTNMPCECMGDTVFDFTRGEKVIVSLTFHHSSHLRWRRDLWRGDQYLTDAAKVAMPQWLKAKGYARLEEMRLEELERHKK